jgi:hypothetical protein
MVFRLYLDHLKYEINNNNNNNNKLVSGHKYVKPVGCASYSQEEGSTGTV